MKLLRKSVQQEKLKKMKNKLVSVAKILNFHGIKGEAKVGYSKQNYNFIQTLKSAFIHYNGEYVPVTVLSVKFNNKCAIMKFKEINSIDELMEYKGCSLCVEEDSLKGSLEEDEFLTSDLIGMEIFADGAKLAVVVGVSNNGGTDLLTVKTASGKISYIPFVKDICKEIEFENNRIIIDNLEGLIEE